MFSTNYSKLQVSSLLLLFIFVCYGCGNSSVSTNKNAISKDGAESFKRTKAQTSDVNNEITQASKIDDSKEVVSKAKVDEQTNQTSLTNDISSHSDSDKESSKTNDSNKSKLKGKYSKTTILSLDQVEQENLLNQRVNLGLITPFERLSKTALVSSSKQLKYGVYPATKSKKISFAKIVDTNPSFYKPTVREYLDNLAIQTKSNWKYSSSQEFLSSDLDYLKVAKGIAVFEFKESSKTLPYSIVLPKDWSKENLGLVLKVKPKDCPVGLDIFDLGQFSSSDKADDKRLLERVRKEVAIMWAKRISKNRNLKDSVLSTSKVGKYKALYFDKIIPTKIGYKAKWRQWVFTVNNRCYLVASIIFPNFEKRLYPQVLDMLKSFQARD